MRSAILAAILAASPAFADSEAKAGGDWIRIHDSPCVSAQTLALIPEKYRADFRKAQGKLGGEVFFGCWTTLDGVVFILWEDGDQSMIPEQAFKQVPSA